jgi:ATP-dependent protease ClpP protease subunit
VPKLRPPAYLPAVVARYRLKNQAAAPDVSRPFWRFEAKSADETELMLYDEIGFSWFDEGITATQFAKDLQSVKTKRLTLRINSPGGEVFDGLAIGNLLAEWPGPKTVKVDSLAASIASVIAVKAGTPTRSQPDNKIIMGRQAQFMIHDASGFAMGNAADMREMADLLDMISNNIATAYADRAGGDPKDWRKVMKGEKWYTDAEAVEAGLADSVVGSEDDAETEACATCDGTGKKSGKPCPDCDGTGHVPADAENSAGGTTCDTCDGSGKIKKGSTECPDCNGSGKVDDRLDGLAAAIRRAYAPAARADLPLSEARRIAARAAERNAEAYDNGGWLPPAVQPVPDDLAEDDIDHGFTDWTQVAAQLASSVKAVVEPEGMDVASWRETFETFRTNMPAPRDAVAPPVDLGPRPAPPVEAPRNELADAIKTGIGTGSINQPEPRPAPAPPGPVDLGPPPERPAPAPEPPRNQLAELIGGAVDLAAKDQPEPGSTPDDLDSTDNPPFRLDVSALKRAVTESRF